MAAGEVLISKTAVGKQHLNTLVQSVCRIRLFCRFMTPLAEAPYRVKMGEKTWTGKADKDGWIEIRSWEGNEKCHLEWGHPKEGEATAEGGAANGPTVEEILASYQTDAKAEVIGEVEYVYETDLFLDLKDGDEQEEALRRLHNLGYAPEGELAERVRAFQRVYRKPLTGSLADVLDDLFAHHDGCKPTKWPSGRDALWSKYA